MTIVKIIKKYEPFVLGFCACGCGEDIEIRGSRNGLKRYKHGHAGKGKHYTKNIIHKNRKGWYINEQGYKILFIPEYPNTDKQGRIREHRYVMEKYLGRYLTADEHIHHINRDKLDNRIENLQIISNSQHISNHMKGNQYGKKDMSGRVCSLCNSDKTRINKNGTPEWRLDEDGNWLCKNCYGKIKYKKIVVDNICLICESNSSHDKWYNYGNGKICKICYNRERSKAKKNKDSDAGQRRSPPVTQ